jgi:hypothetical protein
MWKSRQNKKPNSHIHEVLVVDVEVTQRVQMNIICCILSPNVINLHLTLATLRESQSLVKTLLIMPTSPFLPPPSPSLTVDEVDVVYASMFVMRHLIMIRCALKKERKKEEEERKRGTMITMATPSWMMLIKEDKVYGGGGPPMTPEFQAAIMLQRLSLNWHLHTIVLPSMTLLPGCKILRDMCRPHVWRTSHCYRLL